MILLDGKKVARERKVALKTKVEQLVKSHGRAPHLAAILVGTDGASQTYVNSKEKDCQSIGISSTVLRFDESTTQAQLLTEIEKINNNPAIDGLIVQLPLPKHINSEVVTETIRPEKDVDGFHPFNMGRLALGLDTFVSATPLGIIQMLAAYNIPTSGKHCVVIGRSNIVGRPMSILMSGNSNPGNATVTICHSRTQNLQEMCLQADILIAALGIPEFVQPNMVKPGAVVIDVGITRVDANNQKGYVLKGDVAFEKVKDQTSHITPVPGGVGVMTRIGLLENTVKAFEQSAVKA